IATSIPPRRRSRIGCSRSARDRSARDHVRRLENRPMKMTTRSHRNLPHVVIVAFALAGALVASPASARESAIPRMLVGGRADLARTSALVAFLNDAGLKILAQAS